MKLETRFDSSSSLHNPLQHNPLQRVSSGSVALTAKSAAMRSCNATLAVPIRRIIAFHPGELSGFLFSLPALQALRESFPGARLCSVVRPSLAPFLRDSPLCDEVWERPQGGLSRQTSLMLQLRAWHPDIAVSFSRSRLCTLLAWSSGAEERLGFEGAHLDALLTQRVACDFYNAPEAHLALVQTLGCQPRQTNARDLLTIGPQAETQAAQILWEQGIEGDFIVAMCGAVPQTSVPQTDARQTSGSDHSDEDEHDDLEPEDTRDRAIEYSNSGFSSVIGQGGRAAERVLHAGVQAVRSGASRGVRRGANLHQAVARRTLARRGASRRIAVRGNIAMSDKHQPESAAADAAADVVGNEQGTDESRRSISQWSAALWVEALRELSARAPVVLVGATPFVAVTSRGAERLREGSEDHLEHRVLDLGGVLEPVVIAAILRRARLFVGTDSGILHLAAAVGTPVVGIYGPTDWRRRGPRGVSCRIVRFPVECSPCELSRCLWHGEDNRKCLTQLPPSLVAQAARELIGL